MVGNRREAAVAAMAEARALSTRHNFLLEWCRVNSQALVLPPLFAEIFDIPKVEEGQSACLAPVPQATPAQADSTRMLNV